ncbi:MAG: hypothetical protein ABWY22_12965 [Flavobacterium sp.]
MKKILTALVLVLLSNVTFCQETGKAVDPKLVGCWKGSEVGQQREVVNKYWVSCRFEDGTSTFLFMAIDRDGKVIQQTEYGKWWAENGNYYEQHNHNGVTDIYKYEITDDAVKFKSIELMGKKNDTYIFYDFKIEEDENVNEDKDVNEVKDEKDVDEDIVKDEDEDAKDEKDEDEDEDEDLKTKPDAKATKNENTDSDKDNVPE